MSWSEEFMQDAKTAVNTRSTTLSHRIRNKAWYTGRKQVRGAPRKALGAVAGLIPLPAIGGIVEAGINLGLDKIDKSRKAKKRSRYHNMADPTKESVRKVAKADAKSLKDIATKIDANMPKLKDAHTKANTALTALMTASVGDAVPAKEKLWSVAQGIYERERYEDKLSAYIEAARACLTEIEKYVAQSMEQTSGLEDDFYEELDALEAEVLAQTRLAPGGGGYARM